MLDVGRKVFEKSFIYNSLLSLKKEILILNKSGPKRHILIFPTAYEYRISEPLKLVSFGKLKQKSILNEDKGTYN
jgi:hypothetical protein